MSMHITDTRTGSSERVMRTYSTSDGLARLHITPDRKIWLDCGGDRCALAGTLPDGETITRLAVRQAANQ